MNESLAEQGVWNAAMLVYTSFSATYDSKAIKIPCCQYVALSIVLKNYSRNSFSNTGTLRYPIDGAYICGTSTSQFNHMNYSHPANWSAQPLHKSSVQTLALHCLSKRMSCQQPYINWYLIVILCGAVHNDQQETRPWYTVRRKPDRFHIKMSRMGRQQSYASGLNSHSHPKPGRFSLWPGRRTNKSDAREESATTSGSGLMIDVRSEISIFVLCQPLHFVNISVAPAQRSNR